MGRLRRRDIRKARKQLAAIERRASSFSSVEIFEEFAAAASAYPGALALVAEAVGRGFRVASPDLDRERRRRWDKRHPEYFRSERYYARMRATNAAGYRRRRDSVLSARRASYAAAKGGVVRPHKEYAPYRCRVCGQTGHNARRHRVDSGTTKGA